MLVTVGGVAIATVVFCVLWTRSALRDIDDIGNIKVTGVDDDGLRTSNARR